MKRIHFLVILLAAAVIGLAVACGKGGGDDGVKSSVTDQESNLSDIAKKADGNWKKLSDADKAKFTKAYGTEATAKEMMKNMAHPPNEKYKPKGG